MIYEKDGTFTTDNINESMFSLLRQLEFSLLTNPSDFSKISFSMSSNNYSIYNTLNGVTGFLKYTINTDSTLTDGQLIMNVEN